MSNLYIIIQDTIQARKLSYEIGDRKLSGIWNITISKTLLTFSQDIKQLWYVLKVLEKPHHGHGLVPVNTCFHPSPVWSLKEPSLDIQKCSSVAGVIYSYIILPVRKSKRLHFKRDSVEGGWGWERRQRGTIEWFSNVKWWKLNPRSISTNMNTALFDCRCQLRVGWNILCMKMFWQPRRSANIKIKD